MKYHITGYTAYMNNLLHSVVEVENPKLFEILPMVVNITDTIYDKMTQSFLNRLPIKYRTRTNFRGT